MKNFSKNPVLQNKYSMAEKHPAGNLLEEINEQEMNNVNGGYNLSAAIAHAAGLKGNYGKMCTYSAECMGTISCGS
ncbi:MULTISPECIES: plantaricin C family lantibiotic [Bacillus cereus group]|uniref:plantaricin C family lantibiotic n=1 Tax=Bacillus cereus group TaxID=86661 RepID=UPI0007B6D849|nr:MULTISPECIES: plantaricin C family lantibiotic [Bacillus cereus group]ANC22990.1 hypothetical protein WR52_30220 [Bacillus cereus]MRC29471.1 plantaricin C family lantibiotic [Bacillus thuringiensis]HEF1899672.1 plantaricin C family lantibiotic [Bacillus cereus]